MMSHVYEGNIFVCIFAFLILTNILLCMVCSSLTIKNILFRNGNN